MIPPLGCSKDELDTPALCVDLDRLESNIAALVSVCRRHGVAWRPHAKCHKSPELARLLVQAGAIGVTCAKLGEAEVMADGGVRDLLVANMIVGEKKLARLVQLCDRADPIVTLDHLDQAIPISRAMAAAGKRVRAVIELDIGLNRVGVAPGEQTLALARQIVALPGIHLVGLMAYEGHLLAISDSRRKEEAIAEALGRLVDAKDLLERSGIPCPIASCGGSGSYEYAAGQPGISEIQAGGAIFMDAFYRQQCQVHALQYALTLLTTVVSRPAPARAVIDAGRKAINREIAVPLVQDRDDIVVSRLSAEHGELELAPSAQNLQIGDRLELIPGYADLSIHLHERMHAFRGRRLEAVWPVVARGKLQ